MISKTQKLVGNDKNFSWVAAHLPDAEPFQRFFRTFARRLLLVEIRNPLTREVLCLKNLSTPEQLEILRPRLKLCRRMSLDYTGLGIGLGDFLHRESGSHRVELCPFTSAFKAELFPRLAAAFESRELLMPIAREIREDLHSIYRTATNSGNILYRAHSTPDGHADRTTALALALRVAQTTPVSQCASSIGQKYGGQTFRHRSTRPRERTLALIY